MNRPPDSWQIYSAASVSLNVHFLPRLSPAVCGGTRSGESRRLQDATTVHYVASLFRNIIVMTEVAHISIRPGCSSVDPLHSLGSE